MEQVNEKIDKEDSLQSIKQLLLLLWKKQWIK